MMLVLNSPMMTDKTGSNQMWPISEVGGDCEIMFRMFHDVLANRHLSLDHSESVLDS